MAKVLISLIGTGKSAKGDNEKNEYETVDYILDGQIFPNETLTTSPIIEKYNMDKLYLIGTAESMWDNVADRMGSSEEEYFRLLGKKEQGRLTDSDLKPLAQQIDSKLDNKGSECFIVNSGESDKDMWSNFDIYMQILEKLDDDDVLYLDITHLFRSLSVMSMIMAELGSTYKNIQLGGLFYGMLKKDESSPIINMSIFFEVLEWAKAINVLKRYGSPEALLRKIPSIADEATSKAFQNYSEALMTSDVDAIIKAIKIIKGKLQLFDKLEHKIGSIIVGELRSFIQRFDGKKEVISAFQLELSKFYLETQNYPMFYLTLTEAVVSKVCEMNRLLPENEDDRYEAKGIIKKSYKGTSNEKYRDIFYKINGIRINIAHKTSNTTSYKRSAPKDIIANAQKYLKDLQPFFRIKT